MLDLFLCAFHHCLQFPGSQLSLDGIPQEMKERLSQIQLHQPHSTTEATPSRPSRAESWTATESSVRTVLTTLSPGTTERIQQHTTTYQLGFDSISAVQIASMLRKLGHQVVASDVIEHPTCESLALFIDTSTSDSRSVAVYDLAAFETQVRPQLSAHGLATDTVEAVLPCTPLQSSMMAQFIRSGGQDYFNYVDFELEDGMSTTGLAEAWRAVSATHPMLRTAIVPVEHDGCAFAMLQYSQAGFDTATVVSFQDAVETFGLQSWRLEAARTVAEAPTSVPWRVAVVETRNRTWMHLAIHHALYDAQSLQVILDDLSKSLLGNPFPSRPPTEEVVAAILGQVSATVDSSGNFWREQADRVVINTFPVLTPLRETTRDVLVESATSSVPLTTLEEAAARSGLTLHVVLQAAWTRVLSSYLGEESVVFGVVFSGRNTEATRSAVFPCITTLPVLSTNNGSNDVLLNQLLQYNTELYRHQHQPLTRIQQWLGCPDSKLFDTLLVYQKLDHAATEARPWRVVDEIACVDYPVSIEIEPRSGDQLQYQITFFSDVLSKEQARLLLDQFDAAVQGLALNPQGQEGDMLQSRPDLFSVLPAEMSELPTQIKFLHEFVELQAQAVPDKTALHFVEKFDGVVPVGRRWTYKELDCNGNRVAQLLLPHVQPGDIVAVFFDKCPEAYFSILGILKAGCAFLALDPGAPQARNEFIVQDSGVSALVTSKQGKENLGFAVAVPVLVVDEKLLLSASADAPILSRELQPNDTCYCLYTSGTTGTPKGCEITHDNAVQCMLAFQHIFEGHWQEDSKWLQFASLHFDVSVLEQYWSWSVGITLVAAPRDLILDDLAATISRLEITHIDLTPSLARLLHPDNVPSLCRGVFITGGESLKQEILDVWGSKQVIYNFYGPTEATIGVTVFPRVPTTGRASNIGQQFVNVGSFVLKPGTEQPVLRGGVGELCVSGRLVGKGYLKRDDLTSEKFPTLQRYGERVYRTGDLVRVLHDGCFDFLGRADDQVKLRGQRLEIGEINHAIRKGVETVTDVATLVVRNEAQQKDLLVSFIVASDGDKRREPVGALEIVENPEAARLCQHARDACRSKLPGYMVPTYVLQLPFIPLSSNNKAELKQLRKLFASLDQEKLTALSSSTHRSRLSLSATGEKIAKVLATMQHVDIGLITSESSIFELGIDSISVLRFARALKNEGLVHATPALILRHPLLGDLAVALEAETTTTNFEVVATARQLVQACAHKHRSHACRELGLVPDNIEYIAPCSPLQQGMLSSSATDSAYFNTFQFALAPKVSLDLLRQAFQKTFDALPILRTRFASTTDGFVQVAVKEVPLPWDEVHVKTGTSTEAVVHSSRKSWIERNQENPAQPLEIAVLESEGLPLLVLHIFHGLYDASSLELLLDRVAHEYLALSGEFTASPALSTGPSFLDALCYGPLQDFSNSKAFWVEHFHGAALNNLGERAPHASVTSAAREISFRPLEALRTSLRVTHQALVQAAWVSALASYRSPSPAIGIIVSGRNIDLDGADRVVGPLFNTLPFHADLSKIDGKFGATWASLIRQCHDFNTAVLPFQHVPLRDVQKWCSGGKPLFDTLFSFQRQEKRDHKDGDLWTVVESQPNADYPLALEATLVTDGRLRLLLIAKEDDSNPNMLSALMNWLEQAFVAMAGSPDDLIRSHSSEPPNTGAGDTVVTNGHSTNGHKANGLPVTPHSPDTAFTWTEEAVLVRKEMASLADAEPETITETTPLFGLGLDSIDIIKLSARLKKRGIVLRSSELMKAQTIAGILDHLAATARKDNTNGTNGVSTLQDVDKVTFALREYLTGLGALVKHETVLPTTPLQESMIVEMVASDFQLYFNHDILELPSSVDIHRLKNAWETVIAGSPILRTRFILVEDPSLKSSYCQVIGDETAVYVGTVNLDDTDELAKICETATLRACKSAGRSNLLQLAFASVNDRRFLVLSIAHALYDGWSLSLILQDVQAAYEGEFRPQHLESYTDHVAELLVPDRRGATSFWSEFLLDATPTMFPETAVRRDEGGVVYRDEAISSLSASEIALFCKANAITLQTLGQACWAALLAAKTASLDVTFGVVLSCRDTESLENLVFPTMNTVAVRSVLHGTTSSWLRYMQDNMTNINSHRHFPLREAQKLAHSNGPLFNTLFIQQRGPLGASQEEEESAPLMKSLGGTSAVEYPVCVEMEMMNSKLIWRVACDAAYASRDRTSHMLHELDEILKYFLFSGEADVLAFSGQKVSICGLSPLVLRDAGNTAKIQNPSITEENNEWSSLEKTIRDVLAEVSGVPSASILKSNNIYHLGLDSISAIKVGSLLRKKDVIIGFRDMLKAGSITEMARLVHDAQPSLVAPQTTNGRNTSANGFRVFGDVDLPTVLSGIGFEESAIEAVLPASPMQVHMLSVWQNTDGEVFYPCFRYTLSGQVDIQTIDTAWNALVAGTPILRTVFVSTTSRSSPILQVVLLPSTAGQSRVSGNGTVWTSRVTDNLSQPYHCLQAEKDGDRWSLRLHIHHALYDAISLPAIMERFISLCGTDKAKQTHLPAFAWGNVLAPHHSERNTAARRRFWTEYLAEADSLPLSLESEEHTTQSRVSLVKRSALSGVSAIVGLCKARGVSLQALFFAAYAQFLATEAAESGKGKLERVVFGIYLANRAENNEPGASVYPFLRLVPLRVVLSEGASLLDLAVEIQKGIHDISAPVNVEVGLWEIKDWTGMAVHSFVNFLGAPSPVRDGAEGDLRPEVVENLAADAAAISNHPHHEQEDGWASEIASNPVRDAFPARIPSFLSQWGLLC